MVLRTDPIESPSIRSIESSDPWRHSQIGKAAVCKTVYSRFKSGCRLHSLRVQSRGRVVELADTTDLKSVARKGLRVQVPPRPPLDQAGWHKGAMEIVSRQVRSRG